MNSQNTCLFEFFKNVIVFLYLSLIFEKLITQKSLTTSTRFILYNLMDETQFFYRYHL